MSKFDKYDDYYEGASFQKIHSKGKKPKFKGHQSRHGSSEKAQWAALVEKDDSYELEESIPAYVAPKPQPRPQPASQPSQPEKREFQFGANTHEIKGVKIDFDGVQSIERIENVKDGVKTFGIKFLFKGSKGLFRTIWFNRNQYERDRVYATEYSFWLRLQQNSQAK